MNKETIVKVINRSTGGVGYAIPELNVRRQFAVRETKDIPFGELQALSFIPGGMPILRDYLVIKNEEAVKELGLEVQPEYYYTEQDVKNILLNGSQDEFLDCLDFAPEGVIEMIKSLSVSLPLNDMSKREAIFKKLDFNVTKAIEIENTKYDGDGEDQQKTTPVRRAAAPKTPNGPARRVSPPKYKVVTEE